MENSDEELDLEIGRVYRGANYTDEENDIRDYVRIIGRVDVDTFEYENGYVFYSEEGCIYTKDGWCSRTDDYVDYNLEEEIVPPADYLRIERLRFTGEDPNLPFSVIPVTKIKVGGTYIDRMGFFHLITSAFPPVGKDTEVLYYTNTPSPWNEFGQSQEENKPSMYDLVHEVIYKSVK